MACHSDCSFSSDFSKEQRFWIAIRSDCDGMYVEFFDREIWGFKPSLYIYGSTRDEFIRRLDNYYGKRRWTHPEYRRYILSLVIQIPWGRF